ncbi:MAG TPA: hypothetical protein HPQ03_00805 [Deltaproteobacteria bacterium]|nr:hypothetical protein [Deltaproteobacteria bacterium]
MLKRIFVYAVLVFVLPLMFAHSIFSSVILKRSFSEVVNGAELVFEGRVISKETRLSPENGKPFTYYTFEILDVIKGTYGESFLEMGFMGGQWHSLKLEITDMQMPEVGELGIYFVETLDKQQIHPLYGWQQGHYRIIVDPKTGREMVIPVEKETDEVKGRALILQHGIPLEDFKENIRDAIEGNQ